MRFIYACNFLRKAYWPYIEKVSLLRNRLISLPLETPLLSFLKLVSATNIAVFLLNPNHVPPDLMSLPA